MNELKLIGQSTECKAVDKRRIIVQDTRLFKNLLNGEDRDIFLASTKRQIYEIGGRELVDKINMLVKVIASDIGLRQASEQEITRFTEILRKYYSGISLQEIRLAFEMASVGRLDSYLPVDKNGQPDKNHYQVFSVDYISKILNAYLKRRQETEHKAYTALPKSEADYNPEKVAYYNREWKKTVIITFLKYKYRGKLDNSINAFLIYSELNKLGLAEPIEITEEDKKEAVARLLRKVHAGIIKEFIGECIRRQQTMNSDVISEAGLIAREKALIRSFARMVDEEIQIMDYITLN